jgi:hypothetical protein
MAKIQKLIDETQKDYEKCWGFLNELRVDSSKLTSEAVLDFQPTLAKAIFRLSDMYHSLSKEGKNLISRKETLSPKWFRHRMKTLDAYRSAITETVKIGKVLGDGFAWLFYQGERKYLRKHFRHATIPQVPAGLGGKGELAFVDKVRLWNGQITIFHGITSFLRLGDVSFYDPESKRITAIGELKTEADTGSAFVIGLYVLWPKKSEKVWRQSLKKSDVAKKAVMSHRQEQRLKKQLKAMAGSFDVPKPRRTLRIKHQAHLDEFRALAKQLAKKSAVFQKAGEGLLLAGFTASRERSLFGRLWPKGTQNFDKRLDGLSEQVHSIMDLSQVGSLSNTNSIFYSTLDLTTFPGTTPILWWSLQPDFIRKLIFHEITVVTIYNPAHLIRKLRALGFNALLNGTHLKVIKRIENSEFEMKNMHYFLHLIQQHLVREELVLATFENLIGQIRSGKISPNTMIDLDFQVYY